MISPRGPAAACLLLWCPASVAAQTGTVTVDASATIDAPAWTGATEGCP